MSKKNLKTDNEESLSLHTFTENAYLEYAMYVILDRALPHIGDGLKPVQRRIVYAMSELGLKAGSKYKKSARTVGDVLGKYHPHGDFSCYEAMVHLAQTFTTRYPLIDGQGNWGAQDEPKSFAAMRYTEAKLTKYAESLLSELEQGTVNWVANFDASLKEPEILPARLPNILINGASGIAVGMATDIPPHNLEEVARACILLLDKEDADIEELCQHIKGPDFPTGAEIITPYQELLKIYKSGTGTIKSRASYRLEKDKIIINALPYQASGAKIMEQIADQMQAKKLPMIRDLRDESDHEESVRLVIVLRDRKTEIKTLISHLFATTDLEKNQRINLNLIGLDRRPSVMNLKDLLSQWLVFRRSIVKRRLKFRLEKLEKRLYLLEAFLLVCLNIDLVISIIREEEKPKKVLMQKLAISEEQADYILDTRLRQLARLEEIKIKAEEKACKKEIEVIKSILSSEKKIKNLIKKEILKDIEIFGDKRRSKLIEREEAKTLQYEKILPVEPLTLVLSEKGWIRAAKGHDTDGEKLTYKSGDAFLASIQCRSDQEVVFLDSSGRSYSLLAANLPSARGYGEPLSGRLNFPQNTRPLYLLSSENKELFLISSSTAYGFISLFEDMLTKNKSGKAFFNLKEEELLTPVKIPDSEKNLIAAISSEGRLLIFPLEEMPSLKKGRGNKIISLVSSKTKENQEWLKHIIVFPEGAKLIIQAGKRTLSLKDDLLLAFKAQRGRRGQLLPRGFRNVHGIDYVHDTDE